MKNNISKIFMFCVVLMLALSMSFGVFAEEIPVNNNEIPVNIDCDNQDGVSKVEIQKIVIPDSVKVNSYSVRTVDAESDNPIYVYNITLSPDTGLNTKFTANVTFGKEKSTVPKENKTGLPGITNALPGERFLNTARLIKSAIGPIEITSLESPNTIKAYLYTTTKDSYVATFILSFRVAANDGPKKDEITGISINTPPETTAYGYGEFFDPKGMTLTATLANGGTSSPFREYTYDPAVPLTDKDTTITVSYGGYTVQQKITVASRPALVDANIPEDQGVFIYKPYLLDETQWYPSSSLYDSSQELGKGKIIAAHGVTSVDVELTLPSADTEVYLIGSKDPVEKNADDPRKCVVTVPAGEANSKKLKLKANGVESRTYELLCQRRSYATTPDKVLDFLCINSQYTDGGNVFNPCVGINAQATLLGGSGTDTGQLNQSPYSLGSFGGYITYFYEEPIIDDPTNPYGIDFIVYGNPVHPDKGYCEPGQVYVSDDGETWYALAGSAHYEDFVDWNRTITYQKDEKGLTILTENGETKSSEYKFPSPQRYPLFDWESLANPDTITLSGVSIGAAEGTNEYGNILPEFPAFGYADHGQQYFSSKGNNADNPYLPLVNGEVQGTDGFDLAWAVDKDGRPFDVSTLKDGIHYVKIQSATGIQNGAIGEKSTEINMMLRAASSDSKVGETAAPATVKIAGKAVTFGENNIAKDVPVDGAFFVSVETDADNVFIGDARGSSRAYGAIPKHKMLRVIVQDEEKEPWIGYIPLKEDNNDEAASATTVTFDANRGVMPGDSKITYMAGMPEEDLVFPTPTYEKRTFLGWYDAEGKKYEKYEAGMPKALALTARWKYNLAPGEKEQITVSFRLIGATKASEDKPVDLSKGEEGYNGVKYQTWLATHDYTLPAGSTVIDLINMATKAVGIELKNPGEGNYVTEVKAPESLGGYWLGEFTNGERSGWMYTIDGKHANLGVAKQDLADGNKIILHYVNDYIYEVSDWNDIGSGGTTDDTFFDRWLKAEDKNPEGINPDQPTVDKTGLNAAIEKAEALTAKDYTVDSWKALTDALTAAKAVQSDKDATQKEVDAATKALTEATKALVKKPADMPFTDLASADGKAHWATNAIEYVYQAGLMYGTTGTTFEPDVPLTRGMMVAMLYRLEKEPAVTGTSPFTDVAADTWYTNAVIWANAEGIVKGVTETSFAPEQDITREQMATMLYRYAGAKKYDTTAQAELNAYTDASSVSDYAVDALRWSVKTGLITGMTETTLVPQGDATRAQTAMVLMRFMENVAK